MGALAAHRDASDRHDPAAKEANGAAAGEASTVPIYALERGKFVVDRLARKWALASGELVDTEWVHDSEHDLHYVMFVRAEERLACTAFLGEELKRIHEDATRVDRLKDKLRDRLVAAQLV